MADFSRPEGFRFDFGGVKLNATPDAIPPTKYASAINVRATTQRALRTRPGYDAAFETTASAITDLKSYAALGSDDAPRILTRNAADGIYLDTGSSVATLSGPAGYGVSWVAFRPGASSESWMYVAGLSDYKKLSAPNGSNAVTAQKVGIAEPQSQLEAATNAPSFTSFFAVAASWTAAGTAGAVSNSNLFTDTVGAAVIADPVVATRLSVQVAIPYYSAGMMVTFAGTNVYPVEEVWPACATGTVTAIRYDSGSTGACSIVPSVDLSTTIGRGSLIRLNSSETVLVLSVTQGTNGTCVFRCSTSGTIAAGQAVAGVLAIVVHGTVVAGDAITLPTVNSAITTGTATLSKAIAAGVFSAYSSDDYIHATLLLQNIAAVTSVSFIFNVGNVVDYATSILTYQISGATLAPLLLAGEVVEVHFPISALSAKPGALNPCNGFRVQVVTTANQTISVGGLWVGGGGAPDVGDSGAPYYLRAVPRSGLTGAQGNSTPPMRYGVIPRRQSVTVSVPSAGYDSQITIWDYYAKGGTVTQYGYVGSVEAGASSFTFNYFDDAITAAIAAGRTLPTQNFEPWPSIDVSWSEPATGGTTITSAGTFITVSGPSTWPATILRWLPGTLITLAGFQTYTLRSRPLALSPTAYLFEIEECVGSQSPASVSVAEPDVARQICPYVWGPDAYGTVFGNGDPLRPGTQYFAKAYAPDIAPQSNTLELTSPDKSLLGGVIKGGLSITASTSKWWALYPTPTGAGYTQVEWAVGRSPVSGYAMTTDGNWIYFWTRDGIARTAGGAYESLTSEDLFNLFPHEGVPGENVARLGYTYHAPDYSRAATFRIAVYDNYLYADYQDSTGTPRTLVCDLRTKSWSQDIYGDAITAHYGIDQQVAALTSTPDLYTPLYLASSAGDVFTQADYVNDNTEPIPVEVITFESDGGDLRVIQQWGDLYMDSLPVANITARPVSMGAALSPSTVVPSTDTRTLSPISVGGAVEAKFLGMALSWTENYPGQSIATYLFGWQPSFVRRVEKIIDRISDWHGSMVR